jgi:hypothetical protein
MRNVAQDLDQPGPLDYAARDWYIFPCRPDKKPHTPHGKDDATLDIDQIRAWWKRWPDALIGIYCEKSGFFALDIDNKNGKDGARTWARLIEIHRDVKIPEIGPAQLTPSKGFHLLFRYPKDIAIPNNASQLGEGLDLRSNGYICTGGAYTWLPGHSPDLPIPGAPDWLLYLIRNMKTSPARKHPTRIPAERISATISEESGEFWLQRALALVAVGTRNETGFWLAYKLQATGIAQSEAEQIMHTYAAGVPQPPGQVYGECKALASLKEAYGRY